MDTTTHTPDQAMARFWAHALHLFAEDGNQDMVEHCWAEMVNALTEGK